MKTLQLIFGTLLLSLVFGSSVFAQDAMRADEYRNHPESFRIEGVQKEQFKKIYPRQTL